MSDIGNVSLPDPLPPVDHVRRIAGFWRRTFAFIIDCIVLGIPCFAIGFVFDDFFSYASVSAMLVGIAIQVLYFGILSSSEGGGQTVGQRVLNLEVVDGGGSLLPPGRSLLRSSILFVPFLIAPPAIRSMVALGIFSSVVGALQILIVYLYVFNRRTGQSLHDFAVNAFVVEGGEEGRVRAPSFWRGHLIVLGAIGCIAIVAAFTIFAMFGTRGAFGELVPIREAVLDSGRVRDAGVHMQWSTGGGVRTSGIQVNVVLRQRPVDYDEAARDIAEIVFRTDPKAKEQDYLAIVFQEGFQVGLATFNRTRFVRHAPSEWRIDNTRSAAQ